LFRKLDLQPGEVKVAPGSFAEKVNAVAVMRRPDMRLRHSRHGVGEPT